MTIKVLIEPENGAFDKSTGIGQVINAQYELLPKYGVELVKNFEDADVVAAHVSKKNLPKVDVVHSHGLYFSDVPHMEYDTWHHRINKDIIESVKEAYAVTVPSDWVAMPFRRDMRIRPVVIGHGINLDEWKREGYQDYILYNKNRESDVCSSLPAWELANAGSRVVSTFLPQGKSIPENMAVIGTRRFEEMKKIVGNAAIYLATTLETFGIGTVEALACGVPVLGYKWGGTADIIKHGENGYLVDPGDINGLIEGEKYIRGNYVELSRGALKSSKAYAWDEIIKQYAELYENVLRIKQEKNKGCSVIITNYNYGKYVSEAVNSALEQVLQPSEVIVVDDFSTDDSRKILKEKFSENKKVKLIFHKKNLGVASSRETGMMNATQEHVVCLDADDMMEKTFIKRLLPRLQENRALGIVYGGLAVMDADSNIKYDSSFPPDFSWAIQTTVKNPPDNCIPSASMFRKDMWRRAGGWKQILHPAEDAEFWVRGLSVGFNAEKVTNKSIFQYRMHGKNASQTIKYRAIDYWLPWMRDKRFPMGAPSDGVRIVNSYLEPIISVIIPVGSGHENYLVGAAESVVGQTLREWELILIDDTDPKNSEFDKYVEAYPFAKVIKLRESGKTGTGAGRNAGIDNAVAPYILFLDADDYLLPTALDEMLKKMVETKGEKYVYTDWLSIRGDKITPEQSPEYKHDEWMMQHSTTVLMPRACAEKIRFDEVMETWEDYDFFLRCAINGVCGVRLNKTLFAYRLESGNRRLKAVSESANKNNVKLTDLGSKILKTFNEKYKAYFTGDKKMAGCGGCGGGKAADAIIRAQRLVSRNLSTGLETEQESIDMATTESGKVRLEYIGTNFGAMSFRGLEGRNYRGGLSPSVRFINAHKDDVNKLVSTGKWRLVKAHAPEALSIQSNVPARIEIEKTNRVKKEPVTTGEMQSEAASKILNIKNDLLDPSSDRVDEQFGEPIDFEAPDGKPRIVVEKNKTSKKE